MHEDGSDSIVSSFGGALHHERREVHGLLEGNRASNFLCGSATVKRKPLQVDRQDPRRRSNAELLPGTREATARFALVAVGAVQILGFGEAGQCLVHGAAGARISRWRQLKGKVEERVEGVRFGATA